MVVQEHRSEPRHCGFRLHFGCQIDVQQICQRLQVAKLLSYQKRFWEDHKVKMFSEMLLYGCWTKNRGKPPKSSILIGFSIINYKPSILGYHYFWKHPYTQTIEAKSTRSSTQSPLSTCPSDRGGAKQKGSNDPKVATRHTCTIRAWFGVGLRHAGHDPGNHKKDASDTLIHAMFTIFQHLFQLVVQLLHQTSQPPVLSGYILYWINCSKHLGLYL